MKKNGKSSSEEKSALETTETKENATEESSGTAIVPVDSPFALAPAAFLSDYEKQLQNARKPTGEEFQEVVDQLPEEMREEVVNLVGRLSSYREGLYLADKGVDFLEMRLNQGIGTDPNKPEDLPAGHYYLSSNSRIGKEFEATVIALWEGRSLWPARGADDSAPTSRRPECTSMNRKVGTQYGQCAMCPHRPWANNKQTSCRDEIVALLLLKKPLELVQLRFQKTSEGSGRTLVRYLRSSLAPWMKWYKFSAEVQTNKELGRKWYTIKTETTPNNVQSELQPFCRAMFKLVEHEIILPRIASTYRSAEDNAIDPNTRPMGDVQYGDMDTRTGEDAAADAPKV